MRPGANKQERTSLDHSTESRKGDNFTAPDPIRESRPARGGHHREDSAHNAHVHEHLRYGPLDANVLAAQYWVDPWEGGWCGQRRERDRGVWRKPLIDDGLLQPNATTFEAHLLRLHLTQPGEAGELDIPGRYTTQSSAPHTCWSGLPGKPQCQ